MTGVTVLGVPSLTDAVEQIASSSLPLHEEIQALQILRPAHETQGRQEKTKRIRSRPGLSL